MRVKGADASEVEKTWAAADDHRLARLPDHARRAPPPSRGGAGRRPAPGPDRHRARRRGPDPEGEAMAADAVGAALLVVLEQLTPAERLAFVLHDVFAVPFADVARVLDRTPASARQLASRARRRVRAATRTRRPPIARSSTRSTPRRAAATSRPCSRCCIPTWSCATDDGGGALRIVEGARAVARARASPPAAASPTRRRRRRRRARGHRGRHTGRALRFTIAEGRIAAIDALQLVASPWATSVSSRRPRRPPGRGVPASVTGGRPPSTCSVSPVTNWPSPGRAPRRRVADLAHPADGCRPARLVRLGVHRGPDDAGRDGVDPDAACRVLDGQRPGDRVQPALGQRRQRRRQRAARRGRRGWW